MPCVNNVWCFKSIEMACLSSVVLSFTSPFQPLGIAMLVCIHTSCRVVCEPDSLARVVSGQAGG